MWSQICARWAPILLGAVAISCSAPQAPPSSVPNAPASSVEVASPTPVPLAPVTVHLPDGVPPVRYSLAAGTLVVTPAGVRQVTEGAPRIPDGAFWVTPAGTWVRVRSRHVEFGRGNRVFWRSSSTYPYPDGHQLLAYAVSPAGVAYQITRGGPLYVAAGRGPERLVASHEWEVEWTRAGTLFTVHRSPADVFSYLLLRSDGDVARVLAQDLTKNELDQRGEEKGVMTYVSDGWVWWTDGAQIRRVTNIASLGYDQRAQVYGAGGGLIEVLEPGKDWDVTILRRDGTIYSHPAPPSRDVSGFGAWTADPTGTWAATLSVDEATAVGTVWLLTQGASRGTPITRIARASPCEDPLSWHGHWLLVASHTGKSVAVLAYNADKHRLVRLPSTFDGRHPSAASWG